MENKIKVKDIVFHKPSGLYYICENAKQEKWMNSTDSYVLASINDVPEGYFKKVSLK